MLWYKPQPPRHYYRYQDGMWLMDRRLHWSSKTPGSSAKLLDSARRQTWLYQGRNQRASGNSRTLGANWKSPINRFRTTFGVIMGYSFGVTSSYLATKSLGLNFCNIPIDVGTRKYMHYKEGDRLYSVTKWNTYWQGSCWMYTEILSCLLQRGDAISTRRWCQCLRHIHFPDIHSEFRKGVWVCCSSSIE